MLGLTSCSPIVLGLYGIKNPGMSINDNSIEILSKKFNIPLEDSYVLDTAYLSFLFSFDTSHYKAEIKNHYQPLQVLYYDTIGKLKSFQANCFAGGFPNLRWKKNKILASFPPGEQTPVDSLISLYALLKYLRPLSKTTMFSPDKYEYTVIVFWNRFMGRQSKRLIHFIQENRKLVPNRKVKIIYANNDNIFSSGCKRI